MISNKHHIALMWAVALTLYAACWFLPITGYGSDRLGYDGARIAHSAFFEMVEGKSDVNFKNAGAAGLFLAVFFVIGWMANELFVLGVVTVWKWPRFAVRSLAFSLGIMISWQVGFLGDFPLLIGYWLWVAAGVIALWLSAEKLASRTKSGVLSVITNKITFSFLLFPILNAAAMRALFDVK